MTEPIPPRYLYIARARWGELVAAILAATAFVGAAFIMFQWALDGFLGETDRYSALPAFLLASSFAFAFAFGAGIFGVVAVGRLWRWGKPVDLDAPEILIPRKRWRRIPFTLAYMVATFVFTIFLLGAIGNGNAVAIAFWFLFVLSMLGSIWGTWRNASKTYAPVVLDTEGIQDRRTDRPRIPWHDIAEIDKFGCAMTLIGPTAQRLIAAAPDRRLLKRWLQRPQPKYRIDTGQLEPDQMFAQALIRAYWLRRTAGQEAP